MALTLLAASAACSSTKDLPAASWRLDKKESDAILAFLRAHIAKPEFTVRWRWKQYDLAFWDNRLTQHYATVDYLPHRRVMHRATVLGDVPY